jgi:hypothetical protein
VNKFLPKFIVFGTGASGCMRVTEEAKQFLQEKGIRVYEERTEDAVRRFNALEEGGMAALHLTC